MEEREGAPKGSKQSKEEEQAALAPHLFNEIEDIESRISLLFFPKGYQILLLLKKKSTRVMKNKLLTVFICVLEFTNYFYSESKLNHSVDLHQFRQNYKNA